MVVEEVDRYIISVFFDSSSIIAHLCKPIVAGGSYTYPVNAMEQFFGYPLSSHIIVGIVDVDGGIDLTHEHVLFVIGFGGLISKATCFISSYIVKKNTTKPPLPRKRRGDAD